MNKIICLISGMLILSAMSVEAVKLTIAYENTEQPPYYLGVTTAVPKNNPGVTVEMVKLLETMIDDVEIQFVRRPWKRCLKELELNLIEGTFNSSYKKSRLKSGWYPTLDRTIEGPVDPSRRIATISYSFYVLKESNFSWNGTDLNRISGPVGAPFGFSIVDDLKKNGITVIEAYTTDINFQRLLNNRLAAVALQDVTGDAKLNSNLSKYRKIKKIPPHIKTKPYYLMLSKKFVAEHPALSEKIWDTIKIIRNEKFEEISAKYKQ